MGKKNVQIWEDLIQRMSEGYKEWLESEIKYLKKNIPEDSKVLDVGCGGGRIPKELYPTTKNLVGLDHDEEAVELVEKNLASYPEIKIINGKAEDMPFEDNSFDIIACLGTFCNFGELKEKALAEMKRVVKDDGILIISCYSENAFEERMKMYEKANAEIKEVKGTTIIFNEDIGDNISEQFSKEELEDLFKKSGLDIIEIKKFGIGYDCKLREA